MIEFITKSFVYYFYIIYIRKNKRTNDKHYEDFDLYTEICIIQKLTMRILVNDLAKTADSLLKRDANI
jgi:hypothetical protein